MVYGYGAAPSETAAIALGNLREIYGIRKVEFREAERTVCVEYDSTRLTEPVVRQLLRRTGLDITEADCPVEARSCARGSSHSGALNPPVALIGKVRYSRLVVAGQVHP